MDPIDVAEAERRLELENVPLAYRRFQQREGIPVHRGLAVDHWSRLETGRWERTGQRGAFINLYGNEGVNDLQLHEIEPGGTTNSLAHLHDQLVFVAQGDGLTVVGEGEDAVEFEWSDNALFFLPPNTPYRHVNTSGDRPVRLLADTPLPQLFNTFPVAEAIFDPPGSWWELYRETDLYARGSSLQVVEADSADRINGIPAGTVYWDANYIPDIDAFDKLDANALRGAGGRSVIFPFRKSGLYAHISEFPVGRYKKAHRHHPGANVSVLSGEGFSLMWSDALDWTVRIDWSRGSTFTPPSRWYHQHFNTGRSPARYFAMHGLPLGALEDSSTFDATHEANQIEYVEEDPAIREYFAAELAEKGLESNMPAQCYADPDYEFGTGD
jgi:hypothetical protein